MAQCQVDLRLKMQGLNQANFADQTRIRREGAGIIADISDLPFKFRFRLRRCINQFTRYRRVQGPRANH